MTELMPPDGEELERVNKDAHARYVPKSEDNDGVDSNLGGGQSTGSVGRSNLCGSTHHGHVQHTKLEPVLMCENQ